MSLERLEVTPFAVIAGEIIRGRRTGVLTIMKPPIRREIHWSQGEVVLIIPGMPELSLASFLLSRNRIQPEIASQLHSVPQIDVVSRFHELGLFDMSIRQTLLREWISALFIPLFQLDEGTAAFEEGTSLPPEQRVFMQSTAALLIEGVRHVTNGLTIRKSLGDLKSEMAIAGDSRFDINTLPLSEQERRIADALSGRQPIEAFLKQFPQESLVAARVVIALLALGTFTTEVPKTSQPEVSYDDMQKDLELMAAIGASDPRALQAISFSRQLGTMDHYQVLGVARAASRNQLLAAADEKRRFYNPDTFPAPAREAIGTIRRRIDQAIATLKEPAMRSTYDELLQSGSRDENSVQQRLQQRRLASENIERAHAMIVEGDYYGAILLLKQVIRVLPDNERAWFLLASCQERNPKWRRDAAESYQRVLSLNPASIDALIALGDIYKAQGMISRAQSCYEDAMKIDEKNQQATSRLASLRKR